MASSLATSDYGKRTKGLWACGWAQSSSDLKAGHQVSTGLHLGGQTLQSHWTETISCPRCWTPFIAKNVSWPEPAVVQGVCMLVTQSCLTLCDPMDRIPCQAPLSMGFSRPEYWNGLLFPSPGHLPDPEIEPASPALAGGFSTTEPPGKPGCWGRIQPLICSLLVCHSVWFRTVYVLRAAQL